MKTRAQQIYTFILSAVFFSLGFIEPLKANPEGGSVVAGQATIQQSPGYTQINQSTDKAIINWQSFSIGAGEHTHFQQPNSNSITLNRVIGGDPSRIFGQLSANGKIILINQAGIFFGPGSSVNVAGIIASTARMSDSDFMNGNYRFSQDPNRNAGIVNYGTINAADRGLVALVAPGVENNGTIRANLGKVVLASGTEYTIDLYGDETIQFATGTKVSQTPVDANGNPMKAGVANKGQIYANGGQVLLSARVAEGIVENSINMDGVIEAKSISQQNGKVILDGGDEGVTRVSGQIDVSGLNNGETGGTAKILGKYVALENNAEINASGKTGGGTVLVGGNYQGKGPERNAKATYIGSNAKIKADAIDEGNGGKVIIWSDDVTRFYGSVSANSGINGGNGGFVEISGKWLEFRPSDIQIRTVNGTSGTLLLDPNNITVCNSCTTTNADETAPPPAQIFEPASNSTVTISDDDINFYLAAGTSVIIQTTSSGTQNGDITIESGVNLVGTDSIGHTLTFLADGSITMQNGVSISGGGTTVAFSANDGNSSTNTINIDGTINIGGALALTNIGTGTLTINLNADSSITANSVTIGNPDTIVNLATELNAASVGGNSLTVNVDPTGNINQGILIAANGGVVNLGNETYDQAVTIDNDGAAVILAGPTTSGQAAIINSLTTTATNASVKGNISTGGGAIDFGTTVISLAGDTTLNTGMGNITSNGTINGAYSLILQSGGETKLNTVSGINSLTTDVDGTTTLNNNFTSYSGTITFNDAVNLKAGSTIDFNNGGTGGNVIFNNTLTGTSTNTKLSSSVTNGSQIILNNGADIWDYAGTDGNTQLQLTGALNIAKTSGTFNPVGSIILGSDATITAAGTTDITLNAISGNFDLTLNAGDDVSFLGVASIGGIEINANLSTGIVSFGNTFTTNIGDIIVNGFQITTNGNRTLTSANDINFNAPFNSGTGAVLSASGVITLNSVSVSNTDSFTTTGSGTTVLKGDVTMSQPADVLLNTSVVTIAPTAPNNTLTISGNDITIGGTLSGTGLLVLNSADTGGDQGSKSIAGGTIGSLTTNSNRTTTITGTLTSTLGDLTFNDQVVINSPVTLNSNTYNIKFNNATTALSGAGLLTLNGSGDNTFASAFTIGGLTTDSGGRTLLAHNVTSSAGDLTFNDDVVISADDLTINAGTNSVNFNDSANASGFKLTITAGNTITLSDVTVETLVFSTTPNIYQLKNGLTITDGTDLVFDAPVRLIGDTTINKASANISFDHNISGNYALTLNSGEDVTFNDTVNIGGLVTNADNTIVKTPNLTANSTGFVFNNPVTFNQATTVTSNNGGQITFNTVLNSLYQLTLTANGGSITFADVVGSLQPIANLIIGNAFNVNAAKAVNVGTFTQNAGNGTTNFQTGLYASGNASITTTAIKGNIYAQDTYLDGLSNMLVNVVVSSLTVNGKNGGQITGTVGGYTGELAALVTHLSKNAVGNFVVNGCLLPGGCLADVDAADVSNAIVQNNPEPNQNVCMMSAAKDSKGAAGECAGTVEVKTEELVYAN